MFDNFYQISISCVLILKILTQIVEKICETINRINENISINPPKHSYFSIVENEYP